MSKKKAAAGGKTIVPASTLGLFNTKKQESVKRRLLKDFGLSKKDLPRLAKWEQIWWEVAAGNGIAVTRIQSGDDLPYQLTNASVFAMLAARVLVDHRKRAGSLSDDSQAELVRSFAMVWCMAMQCDGWVNMQVFKNRSRLMNDRKGRKREFIRGRWMSRDEKYAAICREFVELEASMPKVGEREQFLAEQYGFEDRRQIYNIRKKGGRMK